MTNPCPKCGYEWCFIGVDVDMSRPEGQRFQSHGSCPECSHKWMRAPKPGGGVAVTHKQMKEEEESMIYEVMVVERVKDEPDTILNPDGKALSVIAESECGAAFLAGTLMSQIVTHPKGTLVVMVRGWGTAIGAILGGLGSLFGGGVQQTPFSK